ncbi:MAG TPA: dihydropteroate synthase [Firmicutes bacterium]|nr:dihydropteroate synthase [Bacillota bacterium]
MNVNVRIIDIPDIKCAREEMERLSVSPEGIRIMAPKAVFRAVKLSQVPIKAAILLKQEMLAKGGEAATSEGVASLSVEAADVLLLGTLRQFDEALATLKRQPFGLREIADKIEEALRRCESRYLPEVKWNGHVFRPGARTYVMGIVNVTPDSFSDGGKYMDPFAAVEHAKTLVAEGADIIDIGGESTRPGSERVPCDEELRRVIPVVERLSREINIPISVDTYKAEVARRAIEAGASVINDISALRFDPDLGRVAADFGVPVILMHMLGEPGTMQRNPQYHDVVSDIISFFEDAVERAISAGIKPEKIILDPGIGFGKLPEHNLEILRRLREFRALGYPILVGTSRKSFIARIVGQSIEERDDGTMATVALAIAGGADIVRVHDVKRTVRMVRMTDAIVREGEQNG